MWSPIWDFLLQNWYFSLFLFVLLAVLTFFFRNRLLGVTRALGQFFSQVMQSVQGSTSQDELQRTQALYVLLVLVPLLLGVLIVLVSMFGFAFFLLRGTVSWISLLGTGFGAVLFGIGTLFFSKSTLIDPEKLGVYQWLLGGAGYFSNTRLVLLPGAHLVIIPGGQRVLRSTQESGPFQISSLMRQARENEIIDLNNSDTGVIKKDVPMDRQVLDATVVYALDRKRPRIIVNAWYDDFRRDQIEDQQGNIACSNAYRKVDKQVFEIISSRIDEVMQDIDMSNFRRQLPTLNSRLKSHLTEAMQEIGITLVSIAIGDIFDAEPGGYLSQLQRGARATRKAEADIVAAEADRDARERKALANQAAVKAEQDARKENILATTEANRFLVDLEAVNATVALQSQIQRIKLYAQADARAAIALERLQALSPEQLTSVALEFVKSLTLRSDGGAITLVGAGDLSNGYPISAIVTKVMEVLDRVVGSAHAASTTP